MAFWIGIFLAVGISLFARVSGFDRDRVFYPTVLIVIASYYDLFAILGGSTSALALESIAVAGFVSVSLVGFKSNLWWVAGALLAHGVFDWFHGALIANPGVPPWWPRFCLSYDVTAAAALAWLLKGSRIPTRAS